MKKYFNYAILGAIAFVGATGFTACSSEDEIVNNPNYDPVDNTVKAQLAISLASNTGTTTRQADNIVQGQETPIFRGMQDMRLIAFERWVGASQVAADNDGTIKPFNDKVINLGTMSGFDYAAQNAKVYSDLSIPVGTRAFMFYGRATRESATYPSGIEEVDKPYYDKFHTGVLNAPTSYTVAVKNYKTTLQPIQPTMTTLASVNERGTELIKWVKQIRGVASQITNHTAHSYLLAFQPTAGSSASLQLAVTDLWKKVVAITDISAAETTIIRAAIREMPAGTVVASIDDDNNVTIGAQKIGNYPGNVFLPDGAAGIDWEDTNNPQPIFAGHNGDVNIAPLSSYVYPAELVYRANTTIGISDVAKRSESFGTKTWSEIETASGTDALYSWGTTDEPVAVTGTTQSIALRQRINYAVGRLDLTVKAADGTLADAKGASVTVPDGGFPISAILIGDQRAVNFQYTPIAGETSYTIYDREITSAMQDTPVPMAAKAGAAQGYNKTLVLESGSMEEINVCVEFTNTTGAPFTSTHGIVPAGGKFYLVGKLKLANKATGDEYASTATMIFQQDYTTKANFTIAKGTLGSPNTIGLAAAYNVIPDLRTPQLEIAFSVDLEWQKGLTFNAEF